MAEGSAQERTEDATPKKREEARRKGTVAKSKDLDGALVLFVLALFLPAILRLTSTGYIQAFKQSFSNIPRDLQFFSVYRYAWNLLQPALLIFAPFALFSLIIGLAAGFAQVGFVMSLESIKPSFEKVNPLAGLKKLFSMNSFFEGIKAFLKSLVFGYIAWMVIKSQWDTLLGLSWMHPLSAVGVFGMVLIKIFLYVAIAWLVLAVGDYYYQRKQVDKNLRMSKNELKKEMKEQEVSPELRMAIAKKRRKFTRRMMERVQTADAIITNPTHYAIAIKYERNKMHAPMVVAKGADYLALKMREVARDHGVPLVPNPPLARTLYKKCEAGDFIPRELYKAVAEVLAYVYKMINEIG